MARNKYSIKREEGKEKFLKEAVALFGDNPEPLRELVENVCQNILEAEITNHLEAEPYQRSDDRKGYRNGYKPRVIKTRIGKMNFQVPIIPGMVLSLTTVICSLSEKRESIEFGIDGNSYPGSKYQKDKENYRDPLWYWFLCRVSFFSLQNNGWRVGEIS